MADTSTASACSPLSCGVECSAELHLPRNTSEALLCMRMELEKLYQRGDRRAIFLRAYYVMTAQVNAAIRGGSKDFKAPIFFDPAWVDQLAGRFARLYFQSYREPTCEPWEIAVRQARKRRSSVLRNLLLGINAHINYDLALGLHDFLLENGDSSNPLLLARRKFDHDQMNNVLVHCNPRLQVALAREFKGGLRLYSGLLGHFDELLTSTGLRYYRDRVWCNVLGLLSARSSEEREKVRLRLSWESKHVAEFINDGSLLNRLVYGVDGVLSRRKLQGRFQPELDEDMRIGRLMNRRAQLPH
jgi:Family of unknown function (DUF5995)